METFLVEFSSSAESTVFLSVENDKDDKEKFEIKRNMAKRKVTPLIMPRPKLNLTFESETILESDENESDSDRISTSEIPITPNPQLHIQKVIHACVTTNICTFLNANLQLPKHLALLSN